MIDIKLDGIYCKECNELHPTLFWHKLYDDYIKAKEECIPFFKEAAKRFGEAITDEEALELYYINMNIRGLEYSKESGKCVVCKTNTHYKLIETKNFVCSDKCKYKAR